MVKNLSPAPRLERYARSSGAGGSYREIKPMRNISKRLRLAAYLTFFTGLALFFLAVENNSNAAWVLILVSSSPLIYAVANTIRMMEILVIAKSRRGK